MSFQVYCEELCSGNSKVDLTQVVPTRKASPIALATGVSGPAGRRLSVQLGIMPALKHEGGHEKPKDSGAGGIVSPTAGAGAGKASFVKAGKAMSKFKMVAKAVTAMKRFHRPPLTTILSIPQEKAMEKVIDQRHHKQEHEIKELHYSSPCKVAHLCKNERKLEEAARQKSFLEMQTEQAIKKKRRDMWDATISLIAPDNE